MSVAPIAPGGVVGILGGGQLGRMLALAAARLGLKAHVYAPPGDTPAFDVAARHTLGDPSYRAGVEAFAAECDVVTLEFENVPLEAAEAVAAVAPLRPGAHTLAIAQDRLAEKRFFEEIGAPTARNRAVDTLDDLIEGLMAMGGSAFLKTRRLGYDGKGQARIAAESPDAVAAAAAEAFEAMRGAPAILEAAIAFERELSVIIARDVSGAVACYEPAENVHRGGVLHTSAVPGAIAPATAARAQRIAAEIAVSLDYVGVLGVEFFEMSDGRLLVNEIAPRVHNSGHWTEAACVVSQFEQHIRAVCGWPLGAPLRHSDAIMTNLLGDDVWDWGRLAAKPNVWLQLYGKGATRPGRKMGHVVRLLGPADPAATRRTGDDVG